MGGRPGGLTGSPRIASDELPAANSACLEPFSSWMSRMVLTNVLVLAWRAGMETSSAPSACCSVWGLYNIIYIYIYIYNSACLEPFPNFWTSSVPRMVLTNVLVLAWSAGIATSSVPSAWFRGGLVFKAYRRLYHSTLGLRVTKQKKKKPDAGCGGRRGGVGGQGLGVGVVFTMQRLHLG